MPNLDIETNDVKCSHASTVGPIDEDQRFYLESRGVRPEVAERLVVLGFFDEVLEQLPAGDARRRPAPPRRRQAQHRGGGVMTRRDAKPCAPLDDLAPGTAPRFVIAGVPVAVVRIDDDVYAIGDVCSHANVSLSEGEVWCDEKEIECPKHSSTFDLLDRRAGHAAGDAAGAGVRGCGRRRRCRRHGRRSSQREGARLVSTLEITGLRAEVDGNEILQGIDLTVSSGRGARRHGPERRRQEHALGGRDGQAGLHGHRRHR